MKKFSVKKTFSLFKIAFIKWFDRDPFRQGAIIAYNAIFALPGLLVVVISLAGYFFGAETVSGQLHRQISHAMGSSTADSIQEMLIMSIRVRTSVFTTIIGIGTIIFGATAVFVELQKSLNIIWEVKASVTKSGIWVLLKTRLFSFGLILSIAFLLLISLVLSSLLTALGLWIQRYWSESLLVFFQIFNVVLSIGIITILFGLMFKIIPDAKVKWNSVWLGGFVTSLLFVIGKTALGYYFGTSNPGSLYGAAGSIILILLWTSYSSMILFFGAEFTKAYSDTYFGEVPAEETGVKAKARVK